MAQYADRQEVKRLLELDLQRFAARYTGVEAPRLDPGLAVDALNLLEELSRKARTDDDKYLCLLIAGVVWENRRPEWEYVPAFLTQMLGRLGLLPSANMIGPDYDISSDSFSTLGSRIDELRYARRLVENSVSVLDVELTLSAFQKDVWDGISAYSRFGISGPTSAGKSFVLAYKLVELLESEAGIAIYIVPTLALMNQVIGDLWVAIRRTGVKGVDVRESYSLHANDKRFRSIIYVLTQERALLAIDVKEPLSPVKYLFVDEIQNIERVANEPDERSADLFTLIHEIELRDNPKKVVVSGPSLLNLQSVVTEMFGDSAKAISAELPPVLNLSYAFSPSRAGVNVTQYDPVTRRSRELVLKGADLPKSAFGKVRYTESSIEFIRAVLDGLGEGPNLVFAPTKKAAEKVATELWPDSTKEGLEGLPEYIAETVHPSYSLITAVRAGAGFHHSGVPHHVRLCIESAFCEGKLDVIVCTTTLMQGVNLPAKNILVRNPRLSTDTAGPSLTGYEFSNLRGRAGRLMKDFIGRAILLDEEQFADKQISLLEPLSKKLHAGFGERFDAHREEVLEDLARSRMPGGEPRAHADLTTYVRQTILRYGEGAKQRFERVGITLGKMEFRQVQNEMGALSVPREICLRNPHWDPLVLESLYASQRNAGLAVVPQSPSSPAFVDALRGALMHVRDNAPYYWDKYINIDNEDYLTKVCINARKWAMGVSLREIISWKQNMGAEDVQGMLDTIQTKIVYDLPKVVRPLVHMQTPENPVLGFIESGAYLPGMRRLLELGVPRETAVRLIARSRKADAFFSELDQQGLNRLLASTEMGHWDYVQVKKYLG
jgi:hypothetical protein